MRRVKGIVDSGFLMFFIHRHLAACMLHPLNMSDVKGGVKKDEAEEINLIFLQVTNC
jgi:hypothetical protein